MKAFAKSIIMTGVVLSMAFGQRMELKPTPNKVRGDTIPVKTSHGKRTLAARLVLVEGKLPNGVDVVGRLFVFFDPESHYYDWLYNRVYDASTNPLVSIEEIFNKNIFAYIEDSRLVIFLSFGTRVFTRESKEVAATIDEAEALAVKAAANDPGSLAAEYFARWTEISPNTLGAAFLIKKLDVIYSNTNLIEVTKADGKWELLLENQGKAKITLSNDLKVLDVRLIEAPSIPNEPDGTRVK